MNVDEYKKLNRNVSKYRNQKTVWTGQFRGRDQLITFDSKKEQYRFNELLIMQKVGQISDLILQERFPIIDQSNDERGTVYVADFVYRNRKTDEWIVEDVKGKKTDVYKLKKKLFKLKYPTLTFLET